MEVVKQSEFCGEKKKEDAGMLLSDVPRGDIFRASIGSAINPSHVWVKAKNGKAVCIGEPDINMHIGDAAYTHYGNRVRGYEQLDAVIVIKGE